MKEDLQEKTKCRTIKNGKWERKQCIKKCESNFIKDVMKIRLHVSNTKWNYIRNESDTTYPLCRKEEDTKQHEWYARKEIMRLIYCMKMKWTWKKVTIYKNNKENSEKLKQQECTKGKDI